MDNSTSTDRHILHDISRVARNLRSLCGAPDSQCSNYNVLASLPPQLIQISTPICPQLFEMGLPPTLVEEISNAYLKYCSELRSTCELSLRKAVTASNGSVTTEIVQDIVRIWNATYSQQTNVWAESALSRAREWLSKAQSRSIPRSKNSSFNHEYTPLLEKYFQYNAYPSAPDRALLARKSMMTPRQIEVWFQNHRNRAKKEGRTLRKLPSDPLPLELSLQSLEQKMPIFIVPEYERNAAVESAASESEASDEEDTETSPKHLSAITGDDLTIPAPNHAFPTTYSRSCQYVPFPGKPTFSTPIWSRKPATSLRTRPIGEFDDFVADFSAKLVLREAPSMHGGRKNQLPDASASQPWFTATHTFAPPAPHPASIRRSSSPNVACKRSSPFFAVSAPSSRLHPIRSPSPSPQPASLMSPARAYTAVGRKVARLPKRTPKEQGMVQRDASPATSEASPSPSSRSSSTSRVSSSDSDSSTRRSSSSCSSSSSSTVTTPVLLPTVLPEHAQSPVSIAGVDFQDLDSLFGGPPDTFSRLNIPGEHPFNASAFSEKHRFGFGFEVPYPDHTREPS